MSTKKQTGYKLLSIMIVLLVVLISGFGGVATAADDSETIEYNTTEEDSETVRFGDTISFFGDDVNTGDNYVLEERGAGTTESVRDVLYDSNPVLFDDFFIESGSLNIDTGSLFERFVDENTSATGQYSLRSLTQGDVSIQDQSPAAPDESVRVFRSDGQLVDTQTPSSGTVEFSSEVSTFSPIASTQWTVRPVQETLNDSSTLVTAENNSGNLDGFYQLSESNVVVDSVQSSIDVDYDVIDLDGDGVSSQGLVRLNEGVSEQDSLEFTYTHQVTGDTENDVVVENQDGVLNTEEISYDSASLDEQRPREVVSVEHVKEFELVATYEYATSLSANTENVNPTQVDSQNRHNLQNGNLIADTVSVNSNSLEAQVVNSTEGTIEFNDTFTGSVDVSYEYATNTDVRSDNLLEFEETATSGDTLDLGEDSVIRDTVSVVEQSPRGSLTTLSFVVSNSNSGTVVLGEDTRTGELVDNSRQAEVSFEDGLISVDGSDSPSVEVGERVSIEYTYNRQSSDVVVSDSELGFSGFYNINDVGSEISEIQNPSDGISIVDSNNGIIRVQDEGQAGILPGSDFDIDYELVVPTTVFENTQTIQHEFAYDVPYEVELQVKDSDMRVLSDQLVVPTSTSENPEPEDSVVIDTASANVDYVVAVYNLESGSQELAGLSRVFEPSERANNLEIDNLEESILSDNEDSLSLQEGDNVGVVLHDARTIDSVENISEGYSNLTELAEDLPPLYTEEGEFSSVSSTIVDDTATVSYDETSIKNNENPVEESNQNPISEFPFTLLSQYESGEYNENNRLVFAGNLNVGENSSEPTSIPVGSEIVVTGNENIGDKVQISRQDSNGTLSEIQVTESNFTLDRNQVIVDTSLESLGEDISRTGSFEVRDTQGNVLFNYTVVEQNLNATLNPSEININSVETGSTLNISSNLIGYDVLINESSLKTSQMLELFNDSVRDRVSVESPSRGEESRVRLSDIDSSLEQIPVDFSVIDNANTYTFEFQVAGGALASDSATLDALDGPNPDATLTNFGPEQTDERDRFEFAQGDRMRMGVELQAVQEVNVSLSGPDSEFRFTAELVDTESYSNDKFDILLETYTFDGEDAFGNNRDLNDVISLRGASITNTSGELPEISEFLETGEYFIELRIRESGSLVEEDVSTIDIVEPEINRVDTWVMPQGTESNLSGIVESGTPQENVALGDMMVVEMSGTGFDSQELITNRTHPSAFVNYERRVEMDPTVDSVSELMNRDNFVERVPEINLNIESEKPRNRPNVHLLPEEAEGVATQVVENADNTILLFFDLSNPDVFDNFDSDISYNNISDIPEDPIDFVEQRRDEVSNYSINLNYTEDYKYVNDEDNRLDRTEQVETHERMIGSELLETRVEEEDRSTRFVVETSNNTLLQGSTFVAPGTNVDVVLRDDRQEEPQSETFRFEESTTVTESPDSVRNNVVVDANLSSLDESRRMTLEFNPVNEFSYGVVSQEPDVPPEIQDIEAEFETERPLSSENIQFTAVVDNADETNLEYEWDFGDGNSISGTGSPVHVYNQSGVYNVSLEVEDVETELSDSSTFEISVSDEVRTAPRIIDLIVPQTANVGENITMSVVAQDDQVDTEELIYSWSFREDGGNVANGISVNNTYNLPGTAQVTVTVTDPSDNTLSTTAQRIIQVSGDTDPTQNNTTEENISLSISVVESSENSTLSEAQVEVTSLSSNETVSQSVIQRGSNIEETLQAGEYEITAAAEGYDTLTRQVNLTEDQNSTNITLDMSEVRQQNNSIGQNNTTSNNSSGGGGGGSSLLPSLTLILAVVGVAIVAVYIYYRRKMQAQIGVQLAND